MMGDNQTNQFVKGALILTLAGLVSKILSAGYRVPLQNLTGDVGFYIYQQVYPLLGIALILSLYGFPSAISKLTADMKMTGKQISFRHFYGPVLVILLGFGSLVFLLIYLNVGHISRWVGDENLVTAYQTAAFVFLLIPFTSLLRGIFQGSQSMTPTAYSQISEQIVRVAMIIGAAYVIAENGLDYYYIGPAAGGAAIVGSLAALFVLGLFFIKVRPTTKGYLETPWRYFLKTILLFGLVAALNHMILIIIQFADTLTLVPGLMDYGLNRWEAMTMKGIFDRGQPLIQVGAVFGSSVALALIPNLNRVGETVYPSIQSALKLGFYLSFAAMVGLIFILPETNTLLFQNDAGTGSIRILSLSVLLSSIAITGATVLQGLGYLKRTAGFILFAFMLKWIGNQVLVPYLGITGSALATVISLFALCGVVLVELKRQVPKLSVVKSVRWRPFLIASGGMVLYLVTWKIVLSDFTDLSRLSLLVRVVLMAGTGAALYLFLLIRFKAFSKQELLKMPYAALLIKLSKEE